MENTRASETNEHKGSATGENLFGPLYKLPNNIKKIHKTYQVNKPSLADNDPEIFGAKQKEQDIAMKALEGLAVSLMKQQGSVSQPAIVIRIMEPFLGSCRLEIRSSDRGAEMGRAVFVSGDLALQDELCVGDVVVLTSDGSQVIDVDNNFLRAGEIAPVREIHTDQDFPYVLELDNEGYGSRYVEALKWGRLECEPRVGDRVKVLCGTIHAFAPGEACNRFKIIPRDDLDRSDLHGAVPNYALNMILARVDRKFNRKIYPPTGRFGNNDAFFFYGPPGIGKTFSVTVASSMLHRKYNNNGNGEQIVFLRVEGSAIEGSLVGSGPKTLRDIRSAAQQADEEGKLPIVFINEAGSLLRSREVQNMQLDGGSSLSTHEQFLAMLSGPNMIPGIVLIDLNLEKLMDEATRQRFMCIPFPPISTETFVDRMFKTTIEKEQALFQENWKNYRQALMKSLDTAIGTVLVGSETVPVKVGNLRSGRMYENVM